jgi:hypothetical protein
MIMAVIIFSACKKYPQGPELTFRSATARLENNWKVEKVLKNGVEIITGKTNYTQSFQDNSAYSYSYVEDNKTKSGVGKWQFDNNENTLKVDGVSGTSSEDRTILKLKENSFWYTVQEDGEVHEYHLVSN